MAFGDDDGFAAWLEANGLALPDGAPTPVVLRTRGSAYINSTYGPRFSGVPSDGFQQVDSWPRAGAYAYGQAIPDDVVPMGVIHASYEAALQEARAPESLSIIGSAAERVKREKVEGAVEVEYQAAASGEFADTLRPVMTAVEGLLAPFLRVDDSGTGFGLWSVGR